MDVNNIFTDTSDSNSKGSSYGFKPKLDWGYEFDEVASALQKCIRRGREREALFWAAIFYKSGYSKYLKKRLWIIANEDIGIVNPLILVFGGILKLDVEGKKRNGELEKAELSADNFLPLANFIMMCCRSKKTRMADDIINVIFEEIDKGKNMYDIPKIALDPHCDKGRKVFGKWESGTNEDRVYKAKLWFDLFSKVDNEDTEILNEYKEEHKKFAGYYGEAPLRDIKISSKEMKTVDKKYEETISLYEKE